MTLRELLRVVPAWIYIRVYNHGVKFSGYTNFLLDAVDRYSEMLNQEVDHIEPLAYEKIEIILK